MAFPAKRAPAHDLAKWAFFGLIGLCTVLVFFTNEQYWFNPADKFWPHVAAYKGLLIVHALAGATALLAGPIQFSGTIRRRWPRLHRRSGWTYVIAVAIATPLAAYDYPSTLTSVFLVLPATARLEITDGGHRKAAIDKLSAELDDDKLADFDKDAVSVKRLALAMMSICLQ